MTAEELGQVFLRLQDQGAYNINLVTPTQYLPHIISALDQVRLKLTIPVVYNCGGYESAATIDRLKRQGADFICRTSNISTRNFPNDTAALKTIRK